MSTWIGVLIAACVAGAPLVVNWRTGVTRNADGRRAPEGVAPRLAGAPAVVGATALGLAVALGMGPDARLLADVSSGALGFFLSAGPFLVGGPPLFIGA